MKGEFVGLEEIHRYLHHVENEEPSTAGDPRHPDHEAWILELGRVTRSAAQLATICFDLARIVGGVSGEQMYDDPLGGLQQRLGVLDPARSPLLPEFLAALDEARHTRNDIMHAFLVRDGLLRRSSKRRYDRDFYTLSSLTSARSQLETASRLGDRILYADGGEAIEAWRQRI